MADVFVNKTRNNYIVVKMESILQPKLKMVRCGFLRFHYKLNYSGQGIQIFLLLLNNMLYRIRWELDQRVYKSKEIVRIRI